MEGLVQCSANYSPLTPASFLERASMVAALGPNTPELYELHFAVPMVGAIVSPLNIYQESTTLAAELKLLEARVIFVDHQILPLKPLTFSAKHALISSVL
ncbi:hypothetical protein QQP08_007116 [Theobroma cacao]|nr:hypothetical protein QQP08_007116 [Theobroma cacao]